MIQITEKWAVYRDKYQWVLVETYQGKDKDGAPKENTRETFYPWLDSAMRSAAEKDCEGAEVFSDISNAYMKLNHALSDRTRALERGYCEIHTTMTEQARELATASQRIKQLEPPK